MNKPEILNVLKQNNIAYENIDSYNAKQHVASHGNRHPKENLHNRARRVMLTRIASAVDDESDALGAGSKTTGGRRK